MPRIIPLTDFTSILIPSLRSALLIELNQADTISLPTLSSVHSVDILCLVNQKITVALACIMQCTCYKFLPRDATQCAVLLRQVVRPSISLSVRDVEVSWSHRLEFFQNNFTVS